MMVMPFSLKYRSAPGWKAIGEAPEDWRFTGESLRRARLAWWLTRDLELNPPGVAMALDLLDEIAALKAHLKRVGAL